MSVYRSAGSEWRTENCGCVSGIAGSSAVWSSRIVRVAAAVWLRDGWQEADHEKLVGTPARYSVSCKREQTARFPPSADLMHGYQFATLRAQYCILAGIGRSIIPQDTGTSLIRLNAPDAVANFDVERRLASYILPLEWTRQEGRRLGVEKGRNEREGVSIALPCFARCRKWNASIIPEALRREDYGCRRMTVRSSWDYGILTIGSWRRFQLACTNAFQSFCP